MLLGMLMMRLLILSRMIRGFRYVVLDRFDRYIGEVRM